MRPGPGEGTHPLGSPAGWIPGQVAAQYSRLSDDGTGQTRIQSYNQNVSGSLTLVEVGETISGVFEFTADWVTGNDSGETVTRTVIVSGEFAGVVYSQRSDPFDMPRTVPERTTPPPLVGSE